MRSNGGKSSRIGGQRRVLQRQTGFSRDPHLNIPGGLTAHTNGGILLAVSAQEIIEQIKGLPASERAQVVKFVMENDDSWIPESFKKGMSDAAAGRFAKMENVLSGAEPPPRAAE